MLLDVRDVARRFVRGDGSGTVSVLRGVSLQVEPGGTVAVTGPSGSGKSTLVNLMGGLDRPDAGTVTLSGRDLGACTEAELARIRNREIGFVFQLHHLLPQCTVLENVLLPTLPRGRPAREDDDRERAVRLLDRAGLGDRMAHRPGQLSGGECQRVAVVRSLINRPRLLLADEPTGSLDARTATGLADLLLELNREEGTALVVVTHSTDLAGRMDRVYRLDDGVLQPLSGEVPS